MLNHHNPREGKGDFMRHPSRTIPFRQYFIEPIAVYEQGLRAIQAANFSAVDDFVARDFWDGNWEWPEPAQPGRLYPFVPEMGDQMRRSGFTDQDISESLTILILRKIILSWMSGWIVNQDYRLWLSADGDPLFSADEIRWIRHG
jgi:hypothetical protein